LVSLPAVAKPTVFYDSDLTGFGLKAYAHLAADPVRRAADAVSGTIAKAMGEFPLVDPEEIGIIRTEGPRSARRPLEL
jgi:hypothetical protein